VAPIELVGDKPSPGYLSSFYKVLANEERTTQPFFVLSPVICFQLSHPLAPCF